MSFRDGSKHNTVSPESFFSFQLKLQQLVLEVQLTPFSILLRAVLSQLQAKDQYSIFAQPVSITEVCCCRAQHLV